MHLPVHHGVFFEFIMNKLIIYDVPISCFMCILYHSIIVCIMCTADENQFYRKEKKKNTAIVGFNESVKCVVLLSLYTAVLLLCSVLKIKNRMRVQLWRVACQREKERKKKVTRKKNYVPVPARRDQNLLNILNAYTTIIRRT
jgi:hypothetical protein